MVDPTATFSEAIAIIASKPARDSDEALRACVLLGALADWLVNDGFTPAPVELPNDIYIDTATYRVMIYQARDESCDLINVMQIYYRIGGGFIGGWVFRNR